MYIAIWTHHPGDLLGEAIDFVTHGTAQHAGFLRASGKIHEAYFPQVRDRDLIPAELPYIQFFKLKGLTPEQEALFEKAFDIALQVPPHYSILGLFKFLFNVPDTDEKNTFCSRYVFHTIQTVLKDNEELWPLIRCMDKDWVSPRDLYISNLLIPVEYSTIISK